MKVFKLLSGKTSGVSLRRTSPHPARSTSTHWAPIPTPHGVRTTTPNSHPNNKCSRVRSQALGSTGDTTLLGGRGRLPSRIGIWKGWESLRERRVTAGVRPHYHGHALSLSQKPVASCIKHKQTRPSISRLLTLLAYWSYQSVCPCT